MGALQNFLARLSANKFLAGTGGLVILAGIVVTFPKSVSFLPEDIAKEVWNLAHDYVLFILGGALLFVKGHGAIGDPAGKNTAKVDGLGEVAIIPEKPGKIEGDAAANAAGKA